MRRKVSVPSVLSVSNYSLLSFYPVLAGLSSPTVLHYLLVAVNVFKLAGRRVVVDRGLAAFYNDPVFGGVGDELPFAETANKVLLVLFVPYIKHAPTLGQLDVTDSIQPRRRSLRSIPLA